MRPILIFVLFATIIGCATLVTVDTKNDFRITVITDTGKEVDMTCSVGLVSDKGIKLDSECVGFFQDGEDTYRCSVAVNSEGQPVNKRLLIKENCSIVVAK
ncbi:MAG TPA: hypothetical protein PLT75_15265 [Spirochaetota bacterium]|nr:hypothetical protein [Spirochaetota bacterium]